MNNWYAKLHALPSQSNNVSNNFVNAKSWRQRLNQRLNLSIFFRIWLLMSLLLLLCTVLVFEQVFEHLEPMGKRLIEDTLVDNGMVMSQLFAPLLQSGKIYDSQVQNNLDLAFADLSQYPNVANSFVHTAPIAKKSVPNYDKLGADYQNKTHAVLRIYVTNAHGQVIYDSLPKHLGNAEGQDYGQWNDVYLSLQGKYGARSTRSDPNDATTSVMYIARPIIDSQEGLLGVVSIGKPIVTMQSYVSFAKQQMHQTLFWLVLIALIISALMAVWLQQSILMVKHYTQSLANDAIKPNFYLGKELNELTDTIKIMKEEIENKNYVTDYVHTLTHELKSPLTAIKASGELLQEALSDTDRRLLSQSIVEQSDKLQGLIERLLLLAKLEAPTFRLQSNPVNIMTLLGHAIQTRLPQLYHTNLANHAEISVTYLHYFPMLTHAQPVQALHTLQPSDLSELCAVCPQLSADAFWLGQALDNLVSNALQFAKTQIWVVLWTNISQHQDNNELVLALVNDGNHIPDYALDKVFERYFSLTHHMTDTFAKKGSGIGLTLAKEVINYHGGYLHLYNLPVLSTLSSAQACDDEHELLSTLSAYLNAASEGKNTAVAAVVRLPILL